MALRPFPARPRNFATQSVTAVGSLIHLVVVSIARALKWIAGVFVVGGRHAGRAVSSPCCWWWRW